MITHARFRFFLDRPAVMARIGRKKLRVLKETGAYGRKVMKNKYRKPLSVTKLRTVHTPSGTFLVPLRGLVLDAKTNKPATTKEAQEAKVALARQLGRKGAGLPPRRGPTDKLYRFTDFGVDPSTESAVIGAWPFPKQPALVGRVSVPELLDQGGGEYINGVLARYDPRPFTEPSMDPTYRKFEELIERVPL